VNCVIRVSDHALDRLRERSGLNKKSVQRVAEKAYTNGIRHNEVNGSLHKYISSIAYNSSKGTDIRLYGDKVFIFNKTDKHNNKVFEENGRVIFLVTVLQIPNHFSKKLIVVNEKKRNCQKEEKCSS